MNKQVGYSNSTPLIKSARFQGQKIIVVLTDKRVIILPLNRFSEIERLTPAQRKKYKLLAGTGLMFDNLDTVFHVSDFSGKDNVSEFSLVAESRVKYGK